MSGGDPEQSDPELRAAFLAATYGTPGGRFRLSGERGVSPPWARGRWAVVTAWNPGGQRAADEDNARAGADLLTRVTAAGLCPRPAVNGEGEWEEAALIVPGATLRQVAGWGGEFGQAAVLWGVGARAALVWLGCRGRVARVERFWARRGL